jgi:hypothetical protein
MRKYLTEQPIAKGGQMGPTPARNTTKLLKEYPGQYTTKKYVLS